MKVLAVVLCLAVAASARMAYRFSDGYLDVLGAEPLQDFDCVGRPYGYYADVASNCLVFHVCLPITDGGGELVETAHFSFFCGNGTVFSQASLTCDHPDSAFPCSEAETLYELSNADFGRVTEGDFDRVIPAIPEGSTSLDFPSATATGRSNIRVSIAAEDTTTVDVTPEETADEEPEADTTIAIPASVPALTATADVSADIPARVPAATSTADVSVETPGSAPAATSTGEVSLYPPSSAPAATSTADVSLDIPGSAPAATSTADVSLDIPGSAPAATSTGEVSLYPPASAPAATSTADVSLDIPASVPVATADDTIAIPASVPVVTSTADIPSNVPVATSIVDDTADETVNVIEEDEVPETTPNTEPNEQDKMKVLVALLSLAVATSARMAYQFSDGYLDILGAEPVPSFECTGRPYGYYADVASNCQVFHICLPIVNDVGEVAETAHFSFICGNQTIFSQESLTCAHPEESFPCAEAETLYELSNADFGRIPDNAV